MPARIREIENLAPPTDNWPLVRGLVLGALVGASVAGLVVLGLTIQRHRSTRRPRRPPPPAAPSFGAEPLPS